MSMGYQRSFEDISKVFSKRNFQNLFRLGCLRKFTRERFTFSDLTQLVTFGLFTICSNTVRTLPNARDESCSLCYAVKSLITQNEQSKRLQLSLPVCPKHRLISQVQIWRNSRIRRDSRTLQRAATNHELAFLSVTGHN